MAKRTAIGAKQLGVEVAEDVRRVLSERATAERRTMRSVLERAILHYVQTVPVDGIGTALDAAVPVPKRGRPKKDAGAK
jgi:hypothetical protein